jgi:TonB family protein
MTKALTRLTLAALAASLCAVVCAAQTPAAQTTAASSDAAATWVAVRPAGESFDVLMSKHPASVVQRIETGGFAVSGRRYTAAADARTTFVVWSMKGTRAGRRLGAGGRAETVHPGAAPYLDDVAGLARELLVAPEVERLSRDKAGSERLARVNPRMSYVRDFDLNGRPAREYVVNLERQRGPVYVCADAERVYVVAALGADAADPRLKLFANSFVAGLRTPHGGRADTPTVGRSESTPGPKSDRPYLPVPETMQVDPVLMQPEPREAVAGPKRERVGGGDAPADNGGAFEATEVTREARIIYKPEPGFTEQARRNNVRGEVRLRAVLSATGKVTNVVVIKGLPDGLTEKAMAAARYIRFTPAEKDGRPVSQYIVLEYDFNIY